jgi:hypothetical protein
MIIDESKLHEFLGRCGGPRCHRPRRDRRHWRQAWVVQDVTPFNYVYEVRRGGALGVRGRLVR